MDEDPIYPICPYCGEEMHYINYAVDTQGWRAGSVSISGRETDIENEYHDIEDEETTNERNLEYTCQHCSNELSIEQINQQLEELVRQIAQQEQTTRPREEPPKRQPAEGTIKKLRKSGTGQILKINQETTREEGRIVIHFQIPQTTITECPGCGEQNEARETQEKVTCTCCGTRYENY